jgi:dTDP-L-rhamnose 4-epimerase
VGRIVVASSMSIYGEGAYECPEHGLCYPGLRSAEQLARREWDTGCPSCGGAIQPVGTPEEKPLRPTSVYAISKMDQELLCISAGAAYDIGVVALRYFNTYGPRQALSNPYTGVAAIFSGRLLNGKAPLAFEDGRQLRDFIHVRDVARATVAALESPGADGEAINVGVGDPLTVTDVAGALAGALGLEIEPELTGTSRAGDIRHCYADMKMAERLLGFKPEITFDDGVEELIDWVSRQSSDDHVDQAQLELTSRGLAR